MKKNIKFESDNISAICPEIMEEIVRINYGTQPSYGADDYSIDLKKVFSDIFEKEVDIYLTSTGTAANSLAISSIVTSYSTIYCHKYAHIHTSECGAPQLYTGGAKITTVNGKNGKIDVGLLSEAITYATSNRPCAPKPGCISITQLTECGTLYTLEELQEIHTLAAPYNIPIHMDGARFANSVAALNCTPAELTWKSGVDVMSFGATKNGAMVAEAVIFFNKKYNENFDYLYKRSRQLISKTRFFACQFLAYFKNDLWLKNASHANKMGQHLSTIFNQYALVPEYPVEGNVLFVKLPSYIAHDLRKSGCGFYNWGSPNLNLYRFVTSCFTNEESIAEFKNCLITCIRPPSI